MRKAIIAAALCAPLFTLGAQTAAAQIAVSANDGKVRLENGVVKIVPNNPDTAGKWHRAIGREEPGHADKDERETGHAEEIQ